MKCKVYITINFVSIMFEIMSSIYINNKLYTYQLYNQKQLINLRFASCNIFPRDDSKTEMTA